jgi:hypothetical protein
MPAGGITVISSLTSSLLLISLLLLSVNKLHKLVPLTVDGPFSEEANNDGYRRSENATKMKDRFFFNYGRRHQAREDPKK